MAFDKALDVYVAEPGKCVQCGAPVPDGPLRAGNHCADCVRSVSVTPVKDDRTTEKEMRKLARQKLARRELARRRLIAFVQRMKPEYMAGWFHHDLAARLERFLRRVVRQESPRMLVVVPPRRGKSELVSRAFVAWALGQYPWLKFIAATHSDRLAIDNSRDVLQYIKDERYQTVFPELRLDPDNKGAMGWRTTEGGAYKPVGAGAGISGYGAHILLPDDVHRDTEAYSQTVRDTVWRWYRSSASTRLLPGGGICVVGTRWTLDDIIGRLIDEEGLIEDGGKWELVWYPEEAVTDEYRLPDGRVVDYPADGAKLLRRKGESLHPERYPPHLNEEHKKDPVTWQALYQGQPTAGEAAEFKAEWFPECVMADIPRELVHYSAWDTAVSQSQSSAYTAVSHAL